MFGLLLIIVEYVKHYTFIMDLNKLFYIYIFNNYLYFIIIKNKITHLLYVFFIFNDNFNKYNYKIILIFCQYF